VHLRESADLFLELEDLPVAVRSIPNVDA